MLDYLPVDVLLVVGKALAISGRDSFRCVEAALFISALCRSVRASLMLDVDGWPGVPGLRRRLVVLRRRDLRIRRYLQWSPPRGDLLRGCDDASELFEAACDVWLGNEPYNFENVCSRLQLHGSARAALCYTILQESHKVHTLLQIHLLTTRLHLTADVLDIIARIVTRITRAQRDCKRVNEQKLLVQSKITSFFDKR